MTRKLKMLIVVNLVLAAGVLLSLQMERKTTTLDTSSMLFALTDTLGIDRILLGENEFVKTGPVFWSVNGEYQVNPDRLASMLAILQRIEIKRPVPESIKPEVTNAFAEKGLEVNVFAQGEMVHQFHIAGLEGESYAFKNEGEIFDIYIPGYVIDLYDFFSDGPQEWRDKHVLFTTWRTLKQLEVRYPGDPQNSFRIYFDSVFYAVEGVSQLDSAKVYAYIQQYQDFEVQRFLTQEIGLRDSLLRMPPICRITVSDLYEERNNELLIYPGRQVFYGIAGRTNEAVLLDPRMLRNYLLKRDEFVRQ